MRINNIEVQIGINWKILRIANYDSLPKSFPKISYLANRSILKQKVIRISILELTNTASILLPAIDKLIQREIQTLYC